MASRRESFHRNYGFPPEAFDPSTIPAIAEDYPDPEGLEAFAQALTAPDLLPADELASPSSTSLPSRSPFSPRPSDAGVGDPAAAEPPSPSLRHDPASPDFRQTLSLAQQQPSSSYFISAQNDWAPVNEKVKKAGAGAGAGAGGKRARSRLLLGERTKDETREGYLYTLLKWPLFLGVLGVLAVEWTSYLLTRMYIYLYEQTFAWTGTRESLRRNMRTTDNYHDWVVAAKQLDGFLGRQEWKEENEYAYYDSKTVRRVWDTMRKLRVRAERAEAGAGAGAKVEAGKARPVDELRILAEACIKSNFVGVESPRLYSQTYYGTKNLVQRYIEEAELTVNFLRKTNQLAPEEKRVLFKHMHANYGRTALCLSGGAAFAYYHFGVVRALLDADLLPDVITGTSGGALVAALVATRTNDELKELLVPALASRIDACGDSVLTWLPRWWRTGARFDSVDWARRASWWTRGSMTFREAYERTGRILNVSCVPSDPHSPTILCNYLTSPDCVIWSAVLASAAVPGILNPVVLMMKTGPAEGGRLVPYSFGRKWKDGSLRTDIPIKALNLHFNVNFTIVSQVNPHINLFFFSPRGTVGHPVTHRRGAGWRGGYLMSTFENFLKLDMNKWLRFIRHAELLPRPLGQDWSQLWLQDAFAGTVTIWPKSVPSDFINILSDPDPSRLARMLHEGRQGTFPKLKFVANRLRVERLVERGRRETRPWARRGSIETILSEDDMAGLLLDGDDSEGEDTEGTAEEGVTLRGDALLAQAAAGGLKLD
ncbi:probable lipase 5 [Cephalotrichum gorgonifer]|uniref:Patatin-like phospholipase domain-containing protein n=1 Tax=Cephalotrichum gorgonifer TaxID=2041049 RepID=A0AAE8SUM9_9PEZI|nr:probable lipase 5 [Cephalotrichum gorgonifer]